MLTIHREANTEPDRLRRLIESLNATGRTFVFPVHPRTRKVLDEHGIEPAPQLRADRPGRLPRDARARRRGASRRHRLGRPAEGGLLARACPASRCGPRRSGSTRCSPGANTLVDPDDAGRLRRGARAGVVPATTRPQLYGDGRAAAAIADALYTLRAPAMSTSRRRHRRSRLRRRAARARLRRTRATRVLLVDVQADRVDAAEPRRELHRGRALGGAEGPRRRRPA